MKIKLSFVLVIVLLTACSRKTLKGNDYSYYKSEIEKSKRQELLQKEADKKNNTLQEPSHPINKTPRYLSAEERKKFSTLLEVPEKEIKNERLYAVIEEWLGTPYDWGGTTKKGVDCSSYVQQLYQKVYGQALPRTSLEQFYLDTKSHFRNQEYLKEGDLIFFRLRHQDKVVSHVGVYLQNGKFTGSNSPHGVQIADLNADYWQDKYVACARLLNTP